MTELVNFTKNICERKINVHVEFSWGATEAKVVEGLVDAIVEVTETAPQLRPINCASFTIDEDEPAVDCESCFLERSLEAEKN